MKIVIWLLVFSSLLAGCVSPNYNYLPSSIDISEPPIGTVNIAYVGDSMLRQWTYSEHDAILLETRTSVGLLGSYTFDKGYYTKRGDGGDHGFFLPSQYGEPGKVTKCLLCDPFQVMIAYYDKQKICGVSVLNDKACTHRTSYQHTKQQASTLDSFQQTLIYSGRIGDKINLSYREFSGNQARPAFNNDVEYDIGLSSIVGYKSAKIEIIEATNESIRYKVVSNFNRAQP